MPPISCVLIVDDDDGMCETLSDIITEKGFRVVVADSGARAIERAAAQPFDFVLIDIMMPGQNGIETLREIKTTDPYVTTIVMTGQSAMEGLVAEALRAGADAVLYKPFEIEAVLDILEWKGNHGSGFSLIDLRKYEIQPEALRLISEETARTYGMVPLRVNDGVVSVAMSNPRDLEAVAAARSESGLYVDPLRASSSDVQRAIDTEYRNLGDLGNTTEDAESPSLKEVSAVEPTIRVRSVGGTGAEGHASLVRKVSTWESVSPAPDKGDLTGPGISEYDAEVGESVGHPPSVQGTADARSRAIETGELGSAVPFPADTEGPVGEEFQLVAPIARGAIGQGVLAESGKVVELDEHEPLVRKAMLLPFDSVEPAGEESELPATVDGGPIGRAELAGNVQVFEMEEDDPLVREATLFPAVSMGLASRDMVGTEVLEEGVEPLSSVEEGTVTPGASAGRAKVIAFDENEMVEQEGAALSLDSKERTGNEGVALRWEAQDDESLGQAEEESPGQPLPYLLPTPSEVTGGDLEVRIGVAERAVEAPIISTLDSLLTQAVRNGSSDIHIEPQKDCLRVRYRMNGVLHNAKSLPLSLHTSLVSRVKVLSNMNIAERHRPQDGQMSISVDGETIEFQVATSNTAWGEMVVLRALDKAKPTTDLSELGFLPGCLARYSRLLKSPCGLILVSGPTGSGRTSTLYASIHQFDPDEHKVITIEDPIEHRFDGISQIEVDHHADISMAASLRASMRLDPDVILIGDIRDRETAQEAVQAALTGHLVLASIQGTDAVDTLFRLTDLRLEPFFITSALGGVVAQRLARRVCPHCQALREAPHEESLAYEMEMGERRTSFVYGTGCDHCAHTGYKGRIGIHEILVMSEVIRHLLVAGASADQIRAQAAREGMVPLRRDGMEKVKLGVTTPYEVLRSASDLE